MGRGHGAPSTVYASNEGRLTRDEEYAKRLRAAHESIIEWSDPPPKMWNRWGRCVEELKQHPGEWARVARRASEEKARSIAWKSLAPRGAEVTTRKIDGEGWSVWARWPE